MTTTQSDAPSTGWLKVPKTIIAAGPTIGSYAIHVYLILVQHANADSACWPSVGRIATLTGMTARSVRKQLRILERHGLIVVDHRRSGASALTNLYQLTTPQIPPEPNDSTPEPNDRGGGTKRQYPRNQTTVPP